MTILQHPIPIMLKIITKRNRHSSKYEKEKNGDLQQRVCCWEKERTTKELTVSNRIARLKLGY